ncbi:hypothetical protein H310_02664 [Aphanomyces invadans]|uniref:Uncharacterized protein n=1 Tax=Aphanomyces invadans TaxID=157072 RepID=A0A024UJ14_9STRA|nr:hypothetical protein H310_02664 [Aphanomyces invadans]ETW06391.1 hypothetical protein H310_02664 [Aphanomyces invadans]|eukprot:XP_008864466.1 hypothetical protein H310_02664 [Aphanomyces invadans]
MRCPCRMVGMSEGRINSFGPHDFMRSRLWTLTGGESHSLWQQVQATSMTSRRWPRPYCSYSFQHCRRLDITNVWYALVAIVASQVEDSEFGGGSASIPVASCVDVHANVPLGTVTWVHGKPARLADLLGFDGCNAHGNADRDVFRGRTRERVWHTSQHRQAAVVGGLSETCADGTVVEWTTCIMQTHAAVWTWQDRCTPANVTAIVERARDFVPDAHVVTSDSNSSTPRHAGALVYWFVEESK